MKAQGSFHPQCSTHNHTNPQTTKLHFLQKQLSNTALPRSKRLPPCPNQQYNSRPAPAVFKHDPHGTTFTFVCKPTLNNVLLRSTCPTPPFAPQNTIWCWWVSTQHATGAGPASDALCTPCNWGQQTHRRFSSRTKAAPLLMCTQSRHHVAAPHVVGDVLHVACGRGLCVAHAQLKTCRQVACYRAQGGSQVPQH